MEFSSQTSNNTNIPDVEQRLDHALQRLQTQQITLFELIAVLGEADWSHIMLAAVALRSRSEVKQDIIDLVERGLVDPASSGRYRVSTLVREIALQRFRQWDSYYQRAACAVFATYCLKMAQTYAHEAKQEIRPTNHTSLDGIDEYVIQTFRDLIMPEMPHIRQVLVWAEAYQLWDLFLHFTSVAFLDLLSAPGMSDLKQYALLQMATLHKLTLIHGEFNTSLSSCHIIDGVFENVFLPDARWVGVRAPNLILQDIEMVDSHLLGCDLKGGVWVDCDAQKATLKDCDLTGTLFKNVKLYKAQLTDVRLRGAVLSGVSLRGADLRDIDLSGAVLYDVDLRGADLRGANLTGVAARRINLQGCQLESTCWSDAFVEELIVDDETAQRVIEESIASEAEHIGILSPTDELERLERLAHMTETRLDEQRAEWEDITSVDLRAANLAGISLVAADLHDAELCAIVLNQSKLLEVNLRGAQLQVAQFVGADMRKADMSRANLRAADLHRSFLSSATLQRSDASYANFQYAHLDDANLQETNLSYADLLYANVVGANLNGAICTGTNLRGTNLTNAQLLGMARLDKAILPDGRIVARLDGYYADTDALNGMFLQFAFCDGHFLHIDLSNVEMQGAQLGGGFSHVVFANANITDACINGNFSHCDFKGANLAGTTISGSFYDVDWREAAFSQVDLTGAILINTDLTGTGLSETQLRQAHALRGTLLPDGSMYDNRYYLPVDSETACNLGYDPNDEAEMAAFCGDRKPTFKKIV